MKTKLLFKLLALFTALISFNSNAQFINNDKDTKWNIGFNIGGVWQDGDIKLRTPGFGYGFTLGKGVYEAPNHFWSFDIRFRYLKGKTFGQDSELSDITNNPIYSDINSDYISAYTGTALAGKSYLNNKTDIHDFSLEGVANLYWLRKHTGVLLSVFGGLGVTDYRTTTDLLEFENFNKIYNYNTLTTPSVSEIRDIQDNEYESFANFNETQQIKFMPSLGIGLGYQITPVLSIGFEHRVTFTLADKFDGVEKVGTEFLQWGNNDKYHYSSINFRWNIFKGNNSTSKRNKDCKPYVKIAKPKYTTVSTQTIEIKTRVSKIQSNYDVILSLNDSTVQTTYSTSTDYVTGTVKLIEGINHIYFFASNDCGENADSLTLIYNPTYCPKPLIEITEPSANQEISKVQLKATVAHIENATIEVKLNNKVVAHTINTNQNLLTANLTLLKNDNYISIKATNSCGETVVTKHVIFKEKPCFPPVVTISAPVNGRTYKNNTVSFSASATNITNSSQVQVFVNGALVTSSYNVSNKQISIRNVNIQDGNNSIRVNVKNKCGEDTKTVTFTYCEDPVINITNPANGTNNTTGSVTISGTVSNLINQNQIQVLVNGVNQPFNYNSGNKTFTSNVVLSAGNNTIVVNATTTCGNDTKTINVNYTRPCPTPFVTITTPTNGSNNTTGATVITGTVSNVTNKNQIQVKVNGLSKSFTYNTSTRIFTASVSLRSGNNSILVSASTNCGNDSKSISVNYAKSCPTPFVTITSPTNGSNNTTGTTIITGTVSNVTNKNQIQVKVNGLSKSFTYNSSTRIFTATVSLRSGNNSILVSASTNCGNDNKSVSVNYTKPCPAPVVFITSPSNGSNTTSNTTIVTGTVTDVASKNQIQIKVNGVNKTFTYNTSTRVFTATVNLIQGNNTVTVSASTNCGNSTKTVNIIRSQNCPKPIVTISSPLNNNIISKGGTKISGTVINVVSNSQLSVKVNGINRVVSFNSSTKTFTADANFVSGNNTVTVTATTSCGIDTKTVSVLYRCSSPTVNITSPNTGMNYPMSSVSMTGITSGVTAKNQISLTLNGNNITFNFDTRTSKITANLTLIEGQNTIVATATNTCGTSTKTSNVIYTKPCPKPIITITSPVNGGTVHTDNISITGSVINATKSQIQVKVNGVSIPFGMTSTGLISTSYGLIQGNNVITISANTNCGNTTKTVNIIYTPCFTPKVTIVSPAIGDAFSRPNTTGDATLLHVTSKSQLTVTLNGSSIPFTLTGNKITAGLILREGTNTFTVKATSPCGNSTKSVSFNYTKPCVPPTVNIVTPNSTQSVNTNTIPARVNLTNVFTKSQLTVTLNRNTIPYTLSGNVLTANLSLAVGANIFKVTAASICGNDEKVSNITYTIPCIPPTVSILTPANGFTTTSPTLLISGIGNNLTNKSDMTVRLNGVNKTFSYNSSTKKYTATVTLKNGNNVIKVEANTNCGNASKTINVTYNQIINPIVTVFLPTADSTNTTAVQIKTAGTVEKVLQRSQFTIKVNNVSYTGFTFTKVGPNKFEFNGLLNLNPGLNIITYTAIHTTGGMHVITKKVVLPTTQIVKPKGVKFNPVKGSGTNQVPSKGGLSPK